MAVSLYNGAIDLTYGSDQDMEKAYLQYVSGWMFDTFGQRPSVGRLLGGKDDLRAGAHPYAVLSYDYWTRRFGAIGKRSGARSAWATTSSRSSAWLPNDSPVRSPDGSRTCSFPSR